ncbi:hypothetical protein VT85_22655 [Planctomyces sp. SH-PL62]|nr:hypothetical protein VT85_22655 [Planctomyces sp. SH-PL62]
MACNPICHNESYTARRTSGSLSLRPCIRVWIAWSLIGFIHPSAAAAATRTSAARSLIASAITATACSASCPRVFKNSIWSSLEVSAASRIALTSGFKYRTRLGCSICHACPSKRCLADCGNHTERQGSTLAFFSAGREGECYPPAPDCMWTVRVVSANPGGGGDGLFPHEKRTSVEIILDCLPSVETERRSTVIPGQPEALGATETLRLPNSLCQCRSAHLVTTQAGSRPIQSLTPAGAEAGRGCESVGRGAACSAGGRCSVHAISCWHPGRSRPRAPRVRFAPVPPAPATAALPLAGAKHRG